MDKLKLNWYAVSASANKRFRDEGYIRNTTEAMAVRAVSLEEAIGKGIRAIGTLYPSSDGWYGHQACAVEIPRRQWEAEENAATNDNDL